MKTRLLIAMLTMGFFSLSTQAQTTLYGITNANAIFTISNPSMPSVIGGPYTVSGVASGQLLVALDVRPSTGGLYALGYDSAAMTTQLYTITNAGTSFTAHAVGSATTAINLGSTTNATFDFVSTTDNQVRIIARNGNNYVLNADNGAVLSTGGSLFTFATGDVHAMASNTLAATGYTNSFFGSDATTEVGYDAVNNVLVTFTAGAFANGFSNTSNVIHSVGVTTGALITAGSSIGMDVLYDTASHTNTVYLAARTLLGTHLYSYNLSTGLAGMLTDLGAVGSGTITVKDIAFGMVRDSTSAVMGSLLTGLSLNLRNLVFFDSYHPSNILREVRLHGMTTGQAIIGIDYGYTGMLYGLGYNSISHTYQLYTIDTISGTLTAVNGTPATLNLGTDDGSGNYINAGFRFISTSPGRIRITGNNGSVNVQVDAATGLIVSSDATLQYITGDVSFGGTANLTSVAYTGFGGDSVTQMFGFDANTGALVKFNATNSTSGFGNGTSGYINTELGLSSILSLLLHTSAYNNSYVNIAYDNTTSSNIGFMASNYLGDSASQLNFSVLYDMTTMLTAYNKSTSGSPAQSGKIGYGTPVKDIAVRRAAGGPTSITNVTITPQLLAYPNPVVYKTRIQLPEAVTGIVYLDVTDLNGHIVHSSQKLYQSATIDMDMSTFAPGTYTVNVYGASTGMNYVRVVKQ